MGKSKHLFLIGLLTALTVSGCWDRKEINDVGFVMASGYDQGANAKFKATVQVAVPAGLHTAGTGKGGGAEEPVLVISAEGDIVDQVKGKLQAQLSRRLNTSHRGVIIVGEDLARQGMKDLLDEVSRGPMNRLRSYLIIAKGCTAADMMKVRVPIEAYPSEAIREMEKMELGTAGITLRDFFIASTQPGQQPITTAFTLVGKKKDEKSKTFKADGIALFHQLKLVGYLEDEEVIGFDALRGKLSGSNIEVTVPEAGSGVIGIQVRHLQARSKAQFSQGKPSVTYHVNFDAVVTENTSKLDLMNPQYVDRINGAAAAFVKKSAMKALDKLQKHHVDSLGIGSDIYRKHPDQWDKLEQNWEQKHFPSLQVGVVVEANIRQIGMMGPQLQLPDSEVKK